MTDPKADTFDKRFTLRDFALGWRGLCPSCGAGKIFRSYLRVAESCPHCGLALHHQRADDLPAYIVVLITGHIFVMLALDVEFRYSPPFWVHIALWGPALLASVLLLLQPVKGVIVALQWRLGLHGFASVRHR